MNVDKIHGLIQLAMDEARVTLAPGRENGGYYGNGDDEKRCLLGAINAGLDLIEGRRGQFVQDTYCMTKRIADALDCPISEVWDLESGFEGWATSKYVSAAYKIGKELYNTYV